MELKQGTQLQGGRYVIGKVLGQGGFGITYLAEQIALDRKVAVKEFFMKEHCNRDSRTSHVSVPSVGSKELVDNLRKKFLKEARAIASFSNPHIISIYDVFEENGTAYYVMEYLEGGSLANKVKCCALSDSDSLRYIRQIADALAEIHANNLLHLDVKPDNIMLNKKGEAVLIDFGASKRYDINGMQTSCGPLLKSHGYAPLEQYMSGCISTFSPSTDIYSLGATLYNLVTGQVPPHASVIDDNGLPVFAEGYSAYIYGIIEKAMKPRRKDRPQNVKEFLMLLDGLADKNQSVVNDGNTVLVGKLNDEFIIKVDRDEFCTRTYNANGVEFKMIAVEGGEFQMGEEGKWYEFGKDNRAHSVTLSDYYIGETQVTQELWKAVMGINPSNFKDGENLPVDSVNYNDCVKFVEKLNSLLSGQLPNGRKFRLPTEAEWEFAARGGNRSKGFLYAGSNHAYDVAWYNGNSGSVTHPVKQKHANELGLYDMSGNVWEWCYDWYCEYSTSSQTNPKGPSTGSARVLRGGGWDDYARYCRVAYRCYNSPDYRNGYYGLRLAL